MSKLLMLAAAAAGYLYLRRTRPATAQRLEARAKAILAQPRNRAR